MPTRRPLHLHIGHAKAASSTLQSALANDIDALRAAGFLVADEQLQFPATGRLVGAPVHRIGELCAAREAGLKRLVEQLGEQLVMTGDATAPQLVISAESLTTPGAEYLAQALQHAFEIHVLYYVRRQDDWLPSAWSQWGCRQGLTLPQYVERALAQDQPNYLKCIRRWQPFADTVRVRPLNRAALTGGDIVPDFYAAIGAPPPPRAVARRNQGSDRALFEILAQSPFLFEELEDHADERHQNRIRRWLLEQLPASYSGERTRLENTDRERVMAHFRAANETLHREFFPDVDFDEAFGVTAADDSPESDTPNELAGLRRVLGLQFGMIHSLHERVAELEARLRERGGKPD
ncbi:MAG: hypothetical protein NXI31_16870 [bacterium]|nr:hypothetical protein [bacterium]